MALTNGDVLVRVRMTANSGLLEDEIVNTFAFRYAGGLVPNHAAVLSLADAVNEFYNNTDPAAEYNVSEGISTRVDRSATHVMEFVSIVLGGSPFDSVDWLGPAAPVGDSNLPTEVAACLSFHGDLQGVPEQVGGERPRANRRGRIYVGPLRNHVLGMAAPAPVINDWFRTAMAAGAIRMADTALADGFTWSVWSRESAELYPVVAGWTDNAPDTQRRRGQASTSRITWGPVGP